MFSLSLMPRPLALSLALMIGWLPPAFAAKFDLLYGPTPLEFMLSPDYCKPKFDSPYFKRASYDDVRYPKAEGEKWARRLGPVYQQMHHYCNGLLHVNRAQSPSWLERNGWAAGSLWHAAVGEISYTVNADTPDNPLWLEMRINLARALEGVGSVEDAETLYQQMFARAPDAGTLYVALAQMQRRAGDDRAAMATLEQGEQQAKDKAPVYFALAQLHFDLGNRTQAEAYTTLAEKAGLDMQRMRERLAGQGAMAPVAPPPPPGAAAPLVKP